MARIAIMVVALLGLDAFEALARATREMLTDPLAAAPAALLLTAALGVVELHRRRERALLGALGVTRRVAVGLIVLAAAGAEGVLLALSTLA